ncbi:MAG: DUF1566 domain-containing protein [bacterium]|nr:DUF1566 domain-containing protein [bacterium]
MTPLEHEFCRSSVVRQERELAEQEAHRRKELEVQRQIAETEARARQEAERRLCISTAQSLVAYALQKNAEEEREYAALLARQAHLVYQTYKKSGEEHVGDLIDDSLRTILHPLETETDPLVELVCQKLEHKPALTREEWERAVGKEFPQQPRSCFEERDIEAAAPIHLRHERIATEDQSALSLNLKRDGRPKRYVGNAFEQRFDKQKQIILDRATGLMWQNANLPKKQLTYQDARAYVKTLNTKKFAGHEDWRLPTIPELISLVEEEKQENNLYLDPLFDVDKNVNYYWL